MGMFDFQILDVLRDVAAELKKIREELEKANKNEKEKPLALARIVERLEACQEMAYEVKNQINDIYMERRICKEEYCKGRIHAYQRAIEIVKEEGAE